MTSATLTPPSTSSGEVTHDLTQALPWNKLNHLSQEYGDAFFLLNIGQFEANYQEFLGGFRQHYPKTNIGYSYKTNYIPTLCQRVNELGGYAEVVSFMEYEIACQVGVQPERIFFNGPFKTETEIEQALLAGSRVNLDSWREVKILQSLAERYVERSFAVGLRCNFDIGTGRISRFGFDAEGGDVARAFAAVNALINCRVAGLHCHISSSQRSVESFRLRTQKILQLCQDLFRETTPEFISIGGGYFGKMPDDLKAQFDVEIPTYQDYANAVGPQFAAQFNGEEKPELILEPGVAVVSDVLTFACRVVGLKTVKGKNFALTAGSVHNVKPTMTKMVLSMDVVHCESVHCESPTPVAPQETLPGPIDLVGYTCMEHDVLHQDYPSAITVGDYLLFNNLGAYTIVFKPPFIRTNPPILCYDPASDRLTLSRRQETSQDILATFLY